MSSAGSHMVPASVPPTDDSLFKPREVYPPKVQKTRDSPLPPQVDTREATTEDLTIKVMLCRMEVRLLDDLRRASYNWDYSIQVLSGETVPMWLFHIPFSQDKVSGIWAEDDHGGLEWSQDADDEDTDKTRLSISFRHPLKKKEKYSFRFGYESETISIVMPGVFTTTVAYNDWCFHDTQCDKIEITVALPSHSKAMSAVPPMAIDRDPIKFAVLKRRPNEYFSYLISYRRRRIGKQFWLWLASGISSGIVGALVSLFFT